MKCFLLAVLITIIPASVIASDYDESINISQPSFYDQIDLRKNYPGSQYIYSEPVLTREGRANSDNGDILAQSQYYESNRQHHNDSYQDRRYDSHRNHGDYGQQRRRENGKHKQGYDNNRGKYNKDRHDNINRDRDRRRN